MRTKRGQQKRGGLRVRVRACYPRGMGDPPKAPAASKPSNPVRQTGEDIAFEKDEQRRKQAARTGYAHTMAPQRPAAGSVLTTPPATVKKSILG
jgi:hypothetical protein